MPIPPSSESDHEGVHVGVSAASVAKPKEAGSPKKGDDDAEWVPGLRGTKVRRQDCYTPEGKRATNWAMECSRHKACIKTRLDADKSKLEFGEAQPLAYLHAWHSMTVIFGRTNDRLRPSADSVRAFARGHKDGLEAVRREEKHIFETVKRSATSNNMLVRESYEFRLGLERLTRSKVRNAEGPTNKMSPT